MADEAKKPPKKRPYKKKGGRKPGQGGFSKDTWCGMIKEDGTPCRIARMNNGSGRCVRHQGWSEQKPMKVEAFLPGQQYDLPPDMELNSIDDLVGMLSHTLNWVRQGKLPVKIGNAVAILSRELSRLLIAQEKLSPNKQAQRVFSREAAMKMAREMTPEQARDIIQQRNARLLEPMIEAAAEVTAKVAAEVEGRTIDISCPSTPEAEEMLRIAEQSIKRIATSAQKLIDSLPEAAQYEDPEEEEEEDVFDEDIEV